jgi:hypothetical protein
MSQEEQANQEVSEPKEWSDHTPIVVQNTDHEHKFNDAGKDCEGYDLEECECGYGRRKQ